MTKKVKVLIKKLTETATIPQYQTEGAAGFDLHISEEYTLFPNEKVQLPTGLAMEIPEGYELQIRPRSGLSAKTGLLICNSPGTIDSDFRGEIKIIMKNTGTKYQAFNIGDRIAQAVLAPVVQAEFKEVDKLSDTKRGNGAMGSTGV